MVILATGCGGASKHPATSTRPPPPAVLPKLVKSFASTAIGVRGQAPQDWAALRGPGFVVLRNRNESATISIESPGKSVSASKLVAAALAGIKKTYTHVMVERGVGANLGGLPAKSRVVFAVNAHRVPIRILLAGARGTRLNYLLEAFTVRHAPLRDLVEAQQIVLTLRLTG